MKEEYQRTICELLQIAETEIALGMLTAYREKKPAEFDAYLDTLIKVLQVSRELCKKTVK